tara:strand:+ start:38187 stop:38816 length:630 start_codon:yes stop_codon:yes gene_type:complete
MIAPESQQGMSPPRVIVFVKAPRPGRVKTRLAATIGPEAACAAYREMVDTLLDNLTPLPHLELRYTPDNAFNEIRPWLRNQWSTAPQGLGDLGERMHRAFTEAGGPAILIGSDCPEITALDINEAATALKTHNGAIGPAEDGGYWLIGLQLPCPALFNDMCWSTGDVLKQSLARANKANLSLHHLRKLKDVDESNDWKNWKNSRSKYPK